ncbi:MAG: hypothetical protein ABJC98_14815 [Bacteroidota bacterium]
MKSNFSTRPLVHILHSGIMLGLFFFFTKALQAQPKQLPRINQFADLTGTVGQSQGTVAASYVYTRRLGKKRKWEAGLGLRYTGYVGTKKDFITAPGRLARSTTVPFVIVFAGQKTENWDTLTVQRPFVNAVNLSADFGYNFNAKWALGFNIDLIGFSFGRVTSAILSSNGITSTEPAAKPASFNVLLTGDNDYGNLNSEFFLKYRLDDRWGIKAVYGFYFAEYKTNTVMQTAPDGTLVDRFRIKANTLGLGASYNF